MKAEATLVSGALTLSVLLSMASAALAASYGRPEANSYRSGTSYGAATHGQTLACAQRPINHLARSTSTFDARPALCIRAFDREIGSDHRRPSPRTALRRVEATASRRIRRLGVSAMSRSREPSMRSAPPTTAVTRRPLLGPVKARPLDGAVTVDAVVVVVVLLRAVVVVLEGVLVDDVVLVGVEVVVVEEVVVVVVEEVVVVVVDVVTVAIWAEMGLPVGVWEVIPVGRSSFG
jgi:hypothetical protein